MDARQYFAFCSPCRALADLADFGYRVEQPAGAFTLVTWLSINLFEDTPAWHVSVAFLANRRQWLPLRCWAHSDFSFAVDVARSLLAGVGEGDGGSALYEQFSLRLRRPLSAFELAQIETRRLTPAQSPPLPRQVAAFYEVDTLCSVTPK